MTIAWIHWELSRLDRHKQDDEGENNEANGQEHLALGVHFARKRLKYDVAARSGPDFRLTA